MNVIFFFGSTQGNIQLYTNTDAWILVKVKYLERWELSNIKWAKYT